jgi:hypothetical protein
MGEGGRVGVCERKTSSDGGWGVMFVRDRCPESKGYLLKIMLFETYVLEALEVLVGCT